MEEQATILELGIPFRPATEDTQCQETQTRLELEARISGFSRQTQAATCCGTRLTEELSTRLAGICA